MKSKHYFEFKITDSFERRFHQHHVGEYLVKYARSESQSGGVFRIECPSGISVFVRLKVYEIDGSAYDGNCVYHHYSVLQTGRMKFKADLSDSNYDYGSRPFICSVEIILYEIWQKYQSQPISYIESKRYFELKFADGFKRRFQHLNVGEFLMKYTAIGKNEFHCNSWGFLNIEFKSALSYFMKFKLYNIKDLADGYICVLTYYSNFQGQKKFELDLNRIINGYSSRPFICSIEIVPYENWLNTQLHPISNIENKHYFELKLTDNFERRFQQLNIGEYLVKYIAVDRMSFCSEGCGIFTVEFKSDISLLVKLKVYEMGDAELDEFRYVFFHSSILQNGNMIFTADLSNVSSSFFYPRPGPYMCSLQIIPYEKCKIQDSVKKMNVTKSVIGNQGPVTESKLDNLSSDMRRFFAQGELSDVIVSNDSTDIQAHKVVLSARSTVFAKMFQHSMKENLENRITISDVPSEVLKELLVFIYTGVVTINDMKMARDLYVLADKYDVKELKTVCTEHLKDVNIDSVLDTLALANLYRDEMLKQSAFDFISVNYSELKRHKNWNDFIKGNQILALEVVSFALDKRVS